MAGGLGDFTGFRLSAIVVPLLILVYKPATVLVLNGILSASVKTFGIASLSTVVLIAVLGVTTAVRALGGYKKRGCFVGLDTGSCQPPIRDSSRSRSRMTRRITFGLISPRSRMLAMVSRSATSNSRRQLRQAVALSAYSSVVPPASRPEA
ncbi:MAG: hypothetical protein M3157_04985 [Actinomycetota bacterium]|nr:hypothetical protein [Actinomycetota bacterium]